jgi:hypothetical protein
MRPKYFGCLRITFVLLYSDLSQLLQVVIPQVHISWKAYQRFKFDTFGHTEILKLVGVSLQNFSMKALYTTRNKIRCPLMLVSM